MPPEAPRRTIPFDATAEATLANSGAVEARVRELSQHGCFLKFPISLPSGTPLLVKILTESETFEAQGRLFIPSRTSGFATTRKPRGHYLYTAELRMERPIGIEPTPEPWQGSVLPLY
jgi:hypothetical protein